MKPRILHYGLSLLTVIAAVLATTAAEAQQKKPNILIIRGDDVGMYNISAYHRSMMGGSTPNIDRIAKQGMLFMDHYAQGVQQNLVIPYIINLKLDPFERFTESRGYNEWMEDRSFVIPLAVGTVNNLVTSLKEYPPRMKSLDFNVDEIMRSLSADEKK